VVGTLSIIGSFLPGQSKNALGTTSTPAAIAEERPGTQHRIFHFTAFGSTTLILILIAKTSVLELDAAVGVYGLGLKVLNRPAKLLLVR
jgi:hypothetical protein